jgi:alpha-tubulin suppressor-like RCC1 family protein
VARPEPLDTPALRELTDVRDLSGAGSTACAVVADGAVYCWGAPLGPAPASREDHRAGDPPADLGAFAPRRVAGLPPAVQVSVGLRHACARTRRGRVFCWGDARCLVDEVRSTTGE